MRARCGLRWRLAPAAQAKRVCILGVRNAGPKDCISVSRPVTAGARLGVLLVLLEEGYGITLRRAPDVRQACAQAWGSGL
jgi:hypothetical protein